jgi:hypothetical protein
LIGATPFAQINITVSQYTSMDEPSRHVTLKHSKSTQKLAISAKFFDLAIDILLCPERPTARFELGAGPLQKLPPILFGLLWRG